MRGVIVLWAVMLAGCTSLYYAANEKLGREKRDILQSRVEAGRKDQKEAKEQFENALEAFQAATGFQGGKLEDTYKKLNGELERSESRAKDVSESIASIDQVARDLFREWDKEISSMRNRDLRLKSSQIRQETERRYRVLLRKMRESERRMQPVLGAYRDQVLFLKHNLNAKAITSLKNNAAKIDSDVAVLVKDIEASIAESDAFIQALTQSPT
ncbi:MAG: DUF2959 domain-containing protein [Bryobacterales bacterium]|nr:DUF2959 domain-containing protein [Bryobacterales bacterium]